MLKTLTFQLHKYELTKITLLTIQRCQNKMQVQQQSHKCKYPKPTISTKYKKVYQNLISLMLKI